MQLQEEDELPRYSDRILSPDDYRGWVFNSSLACWLIDCKNVLHVIEVHSLVLGHCVARYPAHIVFSCVAAVGMIAVLLYWGNDYFCPAVVIKVWYCSAIIHCSSCNYARMPEILQVLTLYANTIFPNHSLQNCIYYRPLSIVWIIYLLYLWEGESQLLHLICQMNV